LISCFESDCSYRHYLAVAPLPSRTHSPEIGIKVPRPSRACIQIWSLGLSDGVEVFGDDKGEMRCEMVLCIDSGPALELKWCPLPSHDSVCLPKFLQKLEFMNATKKLSGQSPFSPRKLGVLAGVFEDGSLSVYVVPYPQDLASPQPSLTASPIYGNVIKACLHRGRANVRQ
jgi:transcription factor C subunit 6